MALENILSQDMIQRLGWTLLHFIWQATAIALLLAILLAGLRKTAASVRYIMACAALGLIVLLPIATISLIPASTPQSTAHIEPPPAPAIVPMQPITEETPLARVVEYEEPIRLESTNIAPVVPWKQRAIEKLETSLPYLVTGWLIGVFGLSLWHLGGWAQLQRLKRRMVKPVDALLQAKVNQLAARLKASRAARLVESAFVQVPTVVGWLRPVILLPTSALTGLNVEQLEALLAHEVAHIRRYDYLVNILQTIVETLGFYHPAVWWISHKIRVERENCCDDLAVSLSGDRVRYARALTSMEEIRARRNELAVAATGGNLFGRIRRLVALDSSENNHLSWLPSALVITLIVALVLPTTLALSRRSSNGLREIENSLLESLTDPKVNAEGQKILKRMAEVNRYWLVAPSPKVKNYSYDFILYDWRNTEPTQETIKVKRPTRVNSKCRQGITYDSVLHKLISNPSATIIRKIQKNQQMIQLDFIFRDFTKVEYGNGISHSWRGYFSGQVKTGSLWLDATKRVPVKLEAGWPVEYFSEYVAVDESHYVPLKVTVGYDDTRYHWTFGFYEPGLWLFENATYGQDEEGQPRITASINHLNINKRAAVKTKKILVEAAELNEGREVENRKANKQSKKVTLTLTEQGMFFEGQTVTWDQFISLLADVPEAENTGLELAVVSDGLNSDKLNDVKARLSILSRELDFRYLSCINDAVYGPEKSSEEYFFTAPFEFNKDIHIRQNAIAEFRQKHYRTETGWAVDEAKEQKEQATVQANSIRFRKTWLKGEVHGKLKVSYDSWPEAKWRLTIRLFDNKGKRLAQASSELDSRGYIISGKVLKMSSELDFSFGRRADVSKASTFEIAIMPLLENESDSEPSAQFILEKMLEHRARVKNLQYFVGTVIWRDPAAEKDRIEEQIKRMREKASPEPLIEGMRNSLNEVPKTQFQALICTVDDAGHSKIELAKETYDSSGNKVLGKEKHVWAWNGVIETEYDEGGNATLRAKPNLSITYGHPWRSFTGIFCKFLKETVEAERPVSIEELKDGTYRIAFDYKSSRYVAIVDPSKGYTCTLRESYNKQGQLNSRNTATYEEVAEGIWFPVSGKTEHYADDGSVRRKSYTQSKQIKINDPAFNTSYFDVDIPKGTRVRDFTRNAEKPEIYHYGEPRKSSEEIVLKLVDPNSRPMAGARVGTYVDWSDIAENPPIWFLRDGRNHTSVNVKSDELGMVTLEAEEIFGSGWTPEGKAPLTAIDEGPSLAGLKELSREDLGTEVTLMLQPGCRVHGRVSAATARKRRWSTKTLTVYVDWGEHRPCQYSSKEGRFELILPPGQYELKVYAEDPDKAILLPIRIKPDQRNLNLTKYLDGTSKLPDVTSDTTNESAVAEEYEIVFVQYADVSDVVDDINKALQKTLKTELQSSVLLQPIENTGQIIVFGRKDMREIVKKLVAPLDAPDNPLEIKVFQLKYADPDLIKEKIEGAYEYPANETQEKVRVISFPTMKQVAVIASPENLSSIAKQIAEWDVFQAVKPRIIELQNSDPVQMARLLTALFAEEDGEGVNISDLIFGEGVEERYGIAGPLSSHFIFEDVPGTNRILVISNVSGAYEAVVQWICEIDKQKMTTKDVKQIREWIARLVSNDRLGESNINRVGIQIETRILTIDDCFFEDFSLDVNSVDSLKSWPEYFAHDSGNLASFILDQRRVDLLLNATMNHEGAKMLMNRRILVREAEEASVFTGQEIPRVSGYAEPNEPSEKPTPEFEYVKMGTSIRIKAHLMPDKSKVYLDVKSETTQIRGFKERTFMDRYTHMVPQIHTASLGTGNPVPLGKTLLIAGKIITEPKKKETRKFQLADLPFIGIFFHSPTKTEETRNLLILIKPLINPPKRIQAQRKTEPPPPFDPDDPLIKKLEKKLGRSDE